MHNRTLLAVVVILLSFALVGGAEAITYTVKELPCLAGYNGCAQAINDHGCIAGTVIEPTSGKTCAVIWDADLKIKKLESLPGQSRSAAYGINNAGQVVGFSSDANDKHRRAVLWQADGKPQDLGTLSNNEYAYSEARAVNDLGWVAGDSEVKDGSTHAFLWKPGVGMRDLGVLPGDRHSRAFCLDNSGHVIGWSLTSSYKSHAVAWDSDGAIKDLGPVLGLSNGTVAAINNLGQMAGSGAGEDHHDAFFWSPKGGLKDLGRLQNLPRFPGFIDPTPVPRSWASALNDHAEVVGSSTGKATQSRAFFWSQDTGMIELDVFKTVDEKKLAKSNPGKLMAAQIAFDKGRDFACACAINNAGTIVGASNYRPVIWVRSK